MGQTNRGKDLRLVSMMKLTTLTCCLAIAAAVTVAAQSGESITKTKIDVKDGKDVKVTGCVQADPGGTFVLTHVADKTGALHRYVLVSDSDDFAKHIGHRMEIEGTAADRDHGKVEIRSTTKVEGVDKTMHSKSEATGDLSTMPYLGVKHMKMIAASCP
jgi:hypothetical protein